MIEKPKGHLMVNYLGLRGAGKTLSAIYEEVLPRYERGEKIVSNSFINLKGVEYVFSPEDCLKLRNCVLFIDELGDFVDVYDYMNSDPAFRRFLRLSRKRKVDIITTAQDISYIAKYFRVLFSDWVQCENATPVGLSAKILKWLHLFSVKIKQQELTANELARLQKGVGSSPLRDVELDLESESNDDLDLNFDEAELENKVKTIDYYEKDLIRPDLNDFKLFHYYCYCPLCDTRSDFEIPLDKQDFLIDYEKKKGLFLKKEQFCEIHPKTPLQVKEFGIYDSDYEIPVPEVPDLVFKAYTPSPKGYQLVAYKGLLPDTQKHP